MAHNLSMRIRHLLTLKQQENQPPWMHIAVYWLGKNIYNYNKDYYHLKSKTTLKTTKTAPFYCRELIYYIKSQNTNRPNLKMKLKQYIKITQEKVLKITSYMENKNGKKKQILTSPKFGKIHAFHIANPI